LIFDRTDGALSSAWAAGARLYRALGRIDEAQGVASWAEAAEWLGRSTDPISEFQYWGHGKWGSFHVAHDPVGTAEVKAGALEPLRKRLTTSALVWLRTCEAFGAELGHEYARTLADTLGVRVAGHTYIIGTVQSGLRTLEPGKRPTWDVREGLLEGTPEAPKEARGSSPFAARTVYFTTNTFPQRWFAEDGR
jgi:hypothetical protein